MTNLLEGSVSHLPTNRHTINVPDIILLGKTKEAPDLCRSLRAESLGVDKISQTGDVTVALLHDRESEDGQVLTDDAATDRLPLAFTGSARSVAGVAVGQEQSNTGRQHL